MAEVLRSSLLVELLSYKKYEPRSLSLDANLAETQYVRLCPRPLVQCRYARQHSESVK